ncbi:DNA mismatch repair protein MutT [Yersinia enterocolitica]|nr:DNA mismatch repair protein MutT [Yersinia enterocolitica]
MKRGGALYRFGCKMYLESPKVELFWPDNAACTVAESIFRMCIAK